MDSCFLFSLAISCSILGNLGDKYNLKYFVSYAMLLASFFFSAIGFLGIYFENIYFYPVLMVLNGCS